MMWWYKLYSTKGWQEGYETKKESNLVKEEYIIQGRRSTKGVGRGRISWLIQGLTSTWRLWRGPFILYRWVYTVIYSWTISKLSQLQGHMNWSVVGPSCDFTMHWPLISSFTTPSQYILFSHLLQTRQKKHRLVLIFHKISSRPATSLALWDEYMTLPPR